MAGLEIGVDGAASLDAVIRAMGEERDSLPKEFDRVINEVADALVKAAQAKVLAEPTHGTKHTGLRAEIAAGTKKVGVPDGVRIITSMPKNDEAVIPRGMDNGFKGWRHPVFGNMHNWVHQRAAFSWFLDTMQDGKQPAEDGLTKCLQDAADRIARAA